MISRRCNNAVARCSQKWTASIVTCARQFGPVNHLGPIVTANRRYFFCAACRLCEPPHIVASFGAGFGRENCPRRVGEPPPAPFFLCTMSRRRTRPSATSASHDAFGARRVSWPMRVGWLRRLARPMPSTTNRWRPKPPSGVPSVRQRRAQLPNSRRLSYACAIRGIFGICP